MGNKLGPLQPIRSRLNGEQTRALTLTTQRQFTIVYTFSLTLCSEGGTYDGLWPYVLPRNQPSRLLNDSEIIVIGAQGNICKVYRCDAGHIGIYIKWLKWFHMDAVNRGFRGQHSHII